MLPTTKLTEKDKEGAAIVFRGRRGLLWTIIIIIHLNYLF